jgi:quinol monooxygenase YgiN
MVIVHVSVPIKSEARSRWLEIVEAVIGPTRAEEACRSYQVYEDIDAQNRFIFVEEWDGLDGLYRHFQAPHFTEFFAALGDMLARPPEGSVHEVASTLTIDDALRASGVTA